MTNLEVESSIFKEYLINMTKLIWKCRDWDDARFTDTTDQTYIAVPVGSPEIAKRDGGSSNGKTWEFVSYLFTSLSVASLIDVF